MGKVEPRPTSCYCIKLRRAANALTKYYDQMLEPIHLSISQFALLNDIKSLDSCNKSELAQCAKLDRTTIIRNVKILQDKGLVEEIPGTDKRNCLIRLTELGEATILAGLIPWQTAQAKIQAAVGMEHMGDLLKALENLENLL